MDDDSDGASTTGSDLRCASLDHLRGALEEGRDWSVALVEAMAMWTVPNEAHDGRTYIYLVAGEAFDWLTLAERLCGHVEELLPREDTEELLFTGSLPPSLDHTEFAAILGVDKYRGYLNYYYGVTVEEALQLAVELEVLKRYASNGVNSVDDCSEEAFRKIYLSPKSDLLASFRQSSGTPLARAMSIAESREFTYWLFKYRMRISDKARIASDTRKGLEQIERMERAARSLARPEKPERGLTIDGEPLLA
jgi:hypothetical protein